MQLLKDPKRLKRVKRHKRIRAKVYGTHVRPRLSVYRSNAYIYAQLIDDIAGVTLLSVSDGNGKAAGTKTERAFEVGTQLAEEAKKQNITEIVFDRGGFIYTGRIAALAKGAREGGLIF